MVVLNTGDPVLMPWISNVTSVLEMWYPGQEGGTATARLLLGQASPSGKLPITFPASSDQTPFAGHPERLAGVNGLHHLERGALHGLPLVRPTAPPAPVPVRLRASYTRFELSRLRISPTPDGGFTVSVRVRNVGTTKGTEIPQVYVGPSPDAPPGVQQVDRKLVQFDRVELEPGQVRDMRLRIAPRDLSWWSTTGQAWVLGTGVRQVFVGTSSRDLPLRGSITIN